MEINARKKIKHKNKKAQEEILGFALIIILVAVILLVFLGFSIRKSSNIDMIESYEAESFIQSYLQYTTDCKDNLEFLTIQKLILDCSSGERCFINREEKDTCEVLLTTTEEILEKSWKIGENSPIKGYELNISIDEEIILGLQKGETSMNYKGTSEHYPKNINILFTLYS